MCRTSKLVIAAVAIAAAIVPFAAQGKKSHESVAAKAVLWQQPAQPTSRNLIWGPGGEDHAPKPPFTFLDEDTSGTNPKFDVRDANGVRWSVKLGAEAQPEVAASRLVWAAGYFTPYDYYLPEMRAAGLTGLNRGNELVGPGGTVQGVRLKRHEKKQGDWRWAENPFAGTQELDGLKIMMALVNNWDLKTANNAVVLRGGQEIYEVSDLGASFGTPERAYTHSGSKGNLGAYSKSYFVRKLDGDFVDFYVPGRPKLLLAFNAPEYVDRVKEESIGRHIPREHARWLGHLLSELTTQQLQDAFRAAGYPPEKINLFAAEVQDRIVQLNSL
jgi:hypothetical protein